MKILAINGSYRETGITDQVLGFMAEKLSNEGAEVDVVLLRDYPIEFCLNCRACTQQPGKQPGECVHHDGMQALVEKISAADAYILAAPTNFGSVTAIFKRFMERLTVFGYWPWGVMAPKYRLADEVKKKAILISSCAAPGFLGRWLYATHGQLKMTAKIIGAKSIGCLFLGLTAENADARVSDRKKSAIQRLLAKLKTDSKVPLSD